MESEQTKTAGKTSPRTHVIRLSVRSSSDATNEDEKTEVVKKSRAKPKAPKEAVEPEKKKKTVSRTNSQNAPRKKKVEEEPKPVQMMSPKELEFCIEITERMLQNHYAFGFKTPFDPEAEAAKNYLEVIQKPMDLTTVHVNLKSGVYTNKQDWINDISLVWDNALTFNAPQTMYHVAALELKRKFTKLMETSELTEEQKWLRKLALIIKKLDLVESGQ